jgi:hypothetical protein
VESWLLTEHRTGPAIVALLAVTIPVSTAIRVRILVKLISHPFQYVQKLVATALPGMMFPLPSVI